MTRFAEAVQDVVAIDKVLRHSFDTASGQSPLHMVSVWACEQQPVLGQIIENRLHWRLDVSMNEDQARNRLGHGPENLTVLRHMALNLLRKLDGRAQRLKALVARLMTSASYTQSSAMEDTHGNLH